MFTKLREEMRAGAGKRKTNLTRLLGTPAHAAKVSKFLLAIGELMQFRHLNKPLAIDKEEEALGGDGW